MGAAHGKLGFQVVQERRTRPCQPLGVFKHLHEKKTAMPGNHFGSVLLACARETIVFGQLL
jgi:hypothetical protein